MEYAQIIFAKLIKKVEKTCNMYTQTDIKWLLFFAFLTFLFVLYGFCWVAGASDRHLNGGADFEMYGSLNDFRKMMADLNVWPLGALN